MQEIVILPNCLMSFLINPRFPKQGVVQFRLRILKSFQKDSKLSVFEVFPNSQICGLSFDAGTMMTIQPNNPSFQFW